MALCGEEKTKSWKLMWTRLLICKLFLGTVKGAERVWVTPFKVLMVFNTIIHDKATSCV